MLRPAVGEDDAGRAVRLLLLLREMFLQVEAKPERHRLFHALAELFAPVLEAWVGGAEKTLARLLETTLAMAPSLTAADGDGDGGDEAALDSLQGGCLKAMEYLERVGGELLPRRVCQPHGVPNRNLCGHHRPRLRDGLRHLPLGQVQRVPRGGRMQHVRGGVVLPRFGQRV